MRSLAILALLLLACWLFGDRDPAWSGLAGGLMILALPVLMLRGLSLFAGDLRRWGRRGRR